jgi:MFS family permease
MSNAIALNAMAMGLMNLIGPTIAGLIYGVVNPEAVYFTVMGLGLIAVAFTSLLPRMYPSGDAAKKRMWQNLKDGLSYLRSRDILMLLLLQSVVVAMLSMPARMMIAVFAKDVYSANEVEVGILTAAAGVGGLIGALGIAGLRSGQRRGLVMMLAAVLSAISILLMGSLPYYAVGVAVMVGIGLGESGRWALGQALIMEQTEDQYRARVMSVLMMTFGLLPIGLLPLGASMEKYGAQQSVFVMGIMLMVASLLFLAFSKSVRRMS